MEKRRSFTQTTNKRMWSTHSWSHDHQIELFERFENRKKEVDIHTFVASCVWCAPCMLISMNTRWTPPPCVDRCWNPTSIDFIKKLIFYVIIWVFIKMAVVFSDHLNELEYTRCSLLVLTDCPFMKMCASCLARQDRLGKLGCTNGWIERNYLVFAS